MISEYVFRSKYARFNPKERRRETWSEAVDRMMDMHLQKAPHLHLEIEECRRAMKEKEITGSQRALQFGGDAILSKNMRLYNCTSSYADRPRFFAEALWLLLCGCGVGFSVQTHHIQKLPKVCEPSYPLTYVVEDSIEGWADAVNALFEAYLYGGPQPYFEFDRIRPKGSPIRFGGNAPGYKPLESALNSIEDILRSRMFESLRSIDVFDCVMHLADSVLTAGIRRAATIATFDADDELMVNAKTGNWFEENPQRARANISAVITPKTNYETFSKLFKATKQFGEPAVMFFNSESFTVNPCSEIMMCPVLIKKNGVTVQEYTLDMLDPQRRSFYEAEGYTYQSGWQSCNLSTINASKVKTEYDLVRFAQNAAVLGTIQASYTDTGYLGEVSKEIIERESLIGVSICGIMDSPNICTSEKSLRIAAHAVVSTNMEISRKLGIPSASRTTCVKPEGTTSLVLGSASGIHAHHAKRYIRRVNANMDEPVFQAFAKLNPHAVEDSVWGADKVISFALEAPEGAIIKDEMSAVDFMKIARSVQKSWVLEGSGVNRVHGANHNVSITVTVKPDEWDAVKSTLWENRHIYCGLSFLSESGDYDYPQAPLQKVLVPSAQESQAQSDAWRLWNTLRSMGVSVDYNLVIENTDTTSIGDTIACGGGQCELNI